MTLIPKITGTPAKDASLIKLADLTGIFDAITNPNGFSVFTARQSGTITTTSSSSTVGLTAHGLTNNHKLLITQYTGTGNLIQINAIYGVNVLSSSTFQILFEGQTPVAFADTGNNKFNFTQCLSPTNRSLACLASTELTVESLVDGWIKPLNYNVSSDIFFPQAASTIDITLEDLLGKTGVFNDGVYLLKGKLWFNLSSYGVKGCFIDAATDNDNIYPNGFFSPLSSLYGFGDTLFVKVELISDTTKVIYTYMNVEDSSDTNLKVIDDLSSLRPDPNTTTPVNIYVGYDIDTYFIVDSNTITCVSKELIGLNIEERKCCSSCKALDIDNIIDTYIALIAVKEQVRKKLYSDANKNLVAANKLCKSKNCNCD